MPEVKRGMCSISGEEATFNGNFPANYFGSLEICKIPFITHRLSIFADTVRPLPLPRGRRAKTRGSGPSSLSNL